MNHLSIQVFGRVQGVFYRANAAEKARELCLTGFARNEADGSVRIEAEGNAENLNDFLEWNRHGPERARVDKLEYLYGGDLKHFSDFTIQ
jgi:acylphosphatase